MSGRTLCLAIRTVEVDGGRRVRSAPGPVVAGIDPEAAGLGAPPARIEHRDRGVIGEQLLRAEDVFGELLLQRLQPPAGTPDPVSKRRAVDLDAMPGEDLALPVEWKVIAVFGHQDMSEQGRTGQPLADRPPRGGGLMDGPARPAAIARPADSDDPKPRRHMIEHLADRLADQVQLAAAAGARLMLEIEPDVLAGQMRRQAWSIDPRSRRLDLVDGRVASTRAISAWRSSKLSCNWSSSSRSA